MTDPVVSWHHQILVHPRVFPSSVARLANGRLPIGVLRPVFDSDGKPIGHLCPEAARAWAAMGAAAKADGIYLGATDTYRPFAEQQRLWDTRYDHTDHGKGGRTCGGEHRFLKPNCATAACPGESNHGMGIAVDDARLDESGPGLTWLEAHAQRFGFQWEVTSEVWHLQYWPGDTIPRAVLDYEAGHTAPAPTRSPDMPFIVHPEGEGVPKDALSQNFIVGLGAPVQIGGPAAARMLTEAEALYGKSVQVDDITFGGMMAGYTKMVDDIAAAVIRLQAQPKTG